LILSPTLLFYLEELIHRYKVNQDFFIATLIRGFNIGTQHREKGTVLFIAWKLWLPFRRLNVKYKYGKSCGSDGMFPEKY